MTDLDASEARLAAASPGTWAASEYLDDGRLGIVAYGGDDKGISRIVVGIGSRLSHADAALIGHAPTDLRALIEEVRYLRARERELDDKIGSVCDALRCVGSADTVEEEAARVRSHLDLLTAKAEGHDALRQPPPCPTCGSPTRWETEEELGATATVCSRSTSDGEPCSVTMGRLTLATAPWTGPALRQIAERLSDPWLLRALDRP